MHAADSGGNSYLASGRVAMITGGRCVSSVDYDREDTVSNFGSAEQSRLPEPAVFQFSLRKLLFAVFACSVVFAVLFRIALPAFQAAHDASQRTECANDLKQIGIGAAGYADVYGVFPSAYIPDATGAPMHSWRVRLFVFLEQVGWNGGPKYDYNQPWDSSANRRWAPGGIYYYCPSSDRKTGSLDTDYVMVVGEGTISNGPEGTRINDIADGAANTIFCVEIAESGIHWMEPRDFVFNKMSFAINDCSGPSISSRHDGGANVLMADGSVRFLSNDTQPALVRAMLTVANNENVSE